MDGKACGILLRYPYKNDCKVALFDKELGRIDAIIKSRSFCVGSVITYEREYRYMRYYLNCIELIAIPQVHVYHDLIFFHHILELCYYSIPIGSYNKEISTLLFLLSYNWNMFSCKQRRKIIICKLFHAIGMYPEYSPSCIADLSRIFALSIDNIKDKVLDLECEKELDMWLYRCITEHPLAHNFKTIQFLL